MKTKNVLLTIVLLCPLLCFAGTDPVTHPTDQEAWIAFLPVILFFLALLVSLFKLARGGVGLSDLLAEKNTPPTGNNNPANGATANAAGGAASANQPNPPQSVSRFIAFLTGMAALIIGVCLTTFFMYTYFTNPTAKPVDLSNLTTVIWGLGIGVIPYGANKVSSALKTNS